MLVAGTCIIAIGLYYAVHQDSATSHGEKQTAVTKSQPIFPETKTSNFFQKNIFNTWSMVEPYQTILDDNENKVWELRKVNFIMDVNYNENLNNSYYSDLTFSRYQTTSYFIAAELARRHRCDYIIDIGYGKAYKLSKIYPEFIPIGVDFKGNLQTAKERYPEFQFVDVNFDDPNACAFMQTIKKEISPKILSQSIVISTDVIEHIRDPQECYFDTLKYVLQHAPALVLSTPDRGRKYHAGHKGPPNNPAHVREFELSELELMFAANEMYPTLGGWICKEFGKCPNGYRKSDRTFTTMLMTMWNTKTRSTWMQPVQGHIHITAFVFIHKHTHLHTIEYNLKHLLKQGIQIVLLSDTKGLDKYQGDYITVVEVTGITQAVNMIREYITNFTSNDWFMVVDSHEIITTLRDPYLDFPRSIRDLITHIEHTQYNALSVSSVYLNNHKGFSWGKKHPFKIHSNGSWDDGTFKSFTPVNPPEYHVKIWRNIKESHDTLRFAHIKTTREDDIIVNVDFMGLHIFPYNVVGWRTNPIRAIADLPVHNMELQKMYAYELAFLFCSHDRQAMLELSWIY